MILSAASDHTFVVPAFGEPIWIERCLDSVRRQTRPSRIVVTTSTPNAYLSSIAGRRDLPLVVNAVARGIASDWNFALDQAKTEWVSIAHQDDWYEPDYVERCLAAAAAAHRPILVFTDATETRDGETRSVLNARVKRLLASIAYAGSTAIDSALRRRLLLAFGNPIPCPSVMINRRALPDFRFPDGWKSNLDWSAWLSLARAPGAFVRVPERLVHRTLHRDGATTQSLAERASEDDRILHQLWPSPIAHLLSVAYAAGRRPYKGFAR